ncbi:MAG: HD domain-containing protein [Actinobacteria bacterium]|nr:MAG: HD domain-containing protein [Actinomycetota bacterium]
MGARLSRLLDPQAIANTAVSDMRALGYEACTLVADRGEGAMEVAASAAAEGLGNGQVRPADGPVARCLRERRPVLVTDADRDPLYAGKLPPGARSLLAVPLYTGAELWGAIEVCARAPASFDPADAHLVQTIADHIGGALLTAELYRELEQTYVGTAAALAAALEAKDDYTADHAQSIAELAVEVGSDLGLDRRELRDLRYGAIFHDIGKIAVPDAILHKPGKLTEVEFEVVKRHPIAGEQILAPVPFLADVRRIVRHDHERWDGSGYPDGLRGADIPIGARIVFVIDAYHAMVSDRPYRQGMPDSEARMQLRTGAGAQFDPEVVSAFLRVLDRRGPVA